MKLRFSTYDKKWSLLVRERDGYRCQVCGKQKDKFTAHAHHYIRRGIVPTRLMVENGITVCFQCHTANHTFSAHRTPEAFKQWFRDHFPDRSKMVEEKAKTYMTERQAIQEFIQLTQQ